MKKRGLLCVVLSCFVLASASLTGCSKYKAMDKSASGEIDIMTWSGSKVEYIKDIGHQNFGENDLGGGSAEAQIYAVAKAFNQIYPNIKINVFSKAGSESDDKGSWAQHRENFKTEHGKYPDVFWTKNLVEDMNRGLAADLSVFKDDPVYKSINPSLLAAMNYKGVQAGLPSFAQPWGVYVNRSLAEANNLDVPPIKWTFDEYTNFVSSADNKNFYGAMSEPYSNFIDVATKDQTYQLTHRKTGEDYFRVDTPDIRKLLAYVPKWSKSSVWALQGQGKISNEVMDQNSWWGHAFFYNNKVLTNDGDPWMISDPNLNKVEDWDVYPMPAVPGKENGISIVLDAVCVYNYALDDGNPALSEDELKKLKVAYEFTKFYVTDTRAKQALVDTKFKNKETGDLVSSLNDSMPIVTGKEFDKQMDIWYSSSTHQALKDPAKKPGFHEVMKIWESGKVYGSMGIPQSLTVDGQTVWCVNDWWNAWNKELVGATTSEPNWLDNVYAKLPDWQKKINENFAKAEKESNESLKKFYGKTDADLNK